MPRIPSHLIEGADWDELEEELEQHEERERRRLRNHELRVRPETKPPSPLHRKHDEEDR